MAIKIEQVRALVEIYPDDCALRFTLGQKLFEEGTEAELKEALDHLAFVHKNDARNAANELVYAKALLKANQPDEAREILMAGLAKAKAVSAEGHDLVPAIQELLESLD